MAVIGAATTGQLPELRLREQTLTGHSILQRRLGPGLAPDIAVDPANDVAVVRLLTDHDKVKVGGWEVTPTGHPTAGTLATAYDTGDDPTTFYHPEIVALAKNVFGVGYINSWYDTSDPTLINETAEGGVVTNPFTSDAAEVFDNHGPENRIALAAYQGTLLMATDDHPGRTDGLSDVVTSTYRPNSWTPERRVYSYTRPDPRLDSNLVFASNGEAAMVTNRAYVSLFPGDTWKPGPTVPVKPNRCGNISTSAFGTHDLNWFATVPTTNNRCAIKDYQLR